MIQGQVHDENAHAISQTEIGLSAHAGLFGTVHGVLGFSHALMNDKILPKNVKERLPLKIGKTHGLGWESYYPNWSGGDLCSHQTIGHTGFTGTGLWINLEKGMAWTLLTNRVHPTRHQTTDITKLRQEIGNIVAKYSNSF